MCLCISTYTVSVFGRFNKDSLIIDCLIVRSLCKRGTERHCYKSPQIASSILYECVVFVLYLIFPCMCVCYINKKYLLIYLLTYMTILYVDYNVCQDWMNTRRDRSMETCNDCSLATRSLMILHFRFAGNPQDGDVLRPCSSMNCRLFVFAVHVEHQVSDLVEISDCVGCRGTLFTIIQYNTNKKA